MVALLVTSWESGAGKTTICAGLAKNLADSGKKVGFLRVAASTSNNDGAFMKSLLNLSDPVVTDPAQIKDAYTKAAVGKDVVIIEDEKLSASSYKLADALDAKVIVVEGYTGKPSQMKSAYKDFGSRLLGVVIGKVPVSQVERLKKEISAQSGEVKVLGVVPEDRALLSPTVSEIAGVVNGKIVDGEKQLAELVENVMLGAMYVGSGLDYFGRKANKAVVLRVERPDMQLAALETSTKCMVLSGKDAPANVVLRRAKDKKVPIILTIDNVATVVTKIEAALSQPRLNNDRKLLRLAEVLKQSFDFKSVQQALGIAR